MINRQVWAFGLVAIPLAFLLAVVGCTNKINVAPTGPHLPSDTPTLQYSSTSTLTPTTSLTPTASHTLTPTITPTNSLTPLYTYTFTDTPTLSLTFTNTVPPTDTLTFTDTATPSDTPTASLTSTPSNTLTYTPTTPPNPNLIDNLEDNNGQINAQPGVADAGYWYTFGDTGCTIWPSGAFLPSVPETSDGSAYAARFTGTGCSVDGAGVGLNFINNGAGAKIPYNVQALGHTGVRFLIRQLNGTSVNQVRYSISTMGTEPTASGGTCDNSGNKCNDNWGANVMINSSWQPVTLFFQNDFGQEGWGTPATFDLTQAFGMQWKSNNGTGLNFGFEVDDIMWVDDPAPTPDCKPLDNLEDNNGQIITSPAACGRTGYWYTFGDAGCAGSIWPLGAFTPSVPEVSNGSAYAARFTGTGCNVDGAGVGFNFLNNGTGPKIPYSVNPSYTGVRFEIRQVNGTSVNSVRYSISMMSTEPTTSGGACDNSGNKCNDNFGATVPITTGWQSVTLYFQNDFAQEGWGTAGTFDLTQAFGMQWKINNLTGADFGIEVDNIAFVTDPAPPPNCNNVDDMETNNGQIKTSPAACGRNGYWFTFADSDNNLWGQSHTYTGNGTVLSGPGITFQMSTPGQSSTYCANITGTTGPACGPPYTTCPFAGMGFNFKDPKTVYDLTPFTGITFYYKANFVDAAPLRFKIPTVATTVPSDGGTCVSAKCSDDWGQDFLPAQGVWTLRSIKLSPTTAGGDISQIGWGDVYAWNATTALACQWQYTSVAYNFDISVDNITFY